MAYEKLILDKRRANREGKYPVKIYIRHKGVIFIAFITIFIKYYFVLITQTQDAILYLQNFRERKIQINAIFLFIYKVMLIFAIFAA